MCSGSVLLLGFFLTFLLYRPISMSLSKSVIFIYLRPQACFIFEFLITLFQYRSDQLVKYYILSCTPKLLFMVPEPCWALICLLPFYHHCFKVSNEFQ